MPLALRMRCERYHAVLYATLMSRFNCRADNPFFALTMSATATNHLSSVKCVSLKIVPSVTENCFLQSRQTYRMRAGTALISSSQVSGLSRVRVLARLTYFETRLLAQCTHSGPFGQRIFSRRSLQASGVPNALLTSIRFILRGLWM